MGLNAEKDERRRRKTRAAIYARISLDRDGEQLGVKRQLKDCRRVCRDRGWKVTGEYVDNNLSATATRVVRPEYKRLLEDIGDGKIDAVVVYDLDRLTRRPIELEGFVNTCAVVGVTQLVFVGGGIDLGTGDGLLVARIKGAFAAEECRKLSERNKRKWLEIAERGMSLGGGPRPFGFEGDRFTHNLEEVALIREAANRVLGGEKVAHIARDWRTRGISSTTGGTLSALFLGHALRRPRTAGLQIYRDTIIGKAAYDPILDHKTWEQVTFVLSGAGKPKRSPSLAYPLNGILRCGPCGSPLQGALISRSEVIHNYHCKLRWTGCPGVAVSGPRVEEHLFRLMQNLANHPEVREAVQSMADGHLDAVAGLEVQSSKDEQALRHLDDRFGERRIPRATWLEQRRRIETRITERSTAQIELRGWSALDRLAGDWESTTLEEKGLFAESLIKSVRVSRVIRRTNKFNPDRLVIEWRYDGVLAAFLPILNAILTSG